MDQLQWHAGWEPGGEYTKQLVIKNLSSKAMSIKYKLPESKYFSMAFPEPIQLTTGLSKTVQVPYFAPRQRHCLWPNLIAWPAGDLPAS